MSIFVIAEAGVNHDGDINVAHALVEAAAKAGANAVKFQTFKSEKLVTRTAAKANYQKASGGQSESQFEMLKKLELGYEDHHALKAHCRELGLEFMSTPFDHESLDFLVNHVGLKRIKLSSGDLTNAPLVLAAARTHLPLILSSGMASLDDIKQALDVVLFGLLNAKATPSLALLAEMSDHEHRVPLLKQNVTVLQCTTEYPAPPESLNLRVMKTIAETFQINVGFSDHSQGILAAVAAAACGAKVIEKHFTLDKNRPGPDHKASLEPNELAEMINNLRQVEVMLGQGEKSRLDVEESNAAVARKSLVAAKAIAPGEAFSAENLTIKRPGTGRAPINYWDSLGEIAPRAYQPDEVIEP